MSPRVIQVLLPLPFDRAFDYSVPEGMEIAAGTYVKVPFGQRTLYGVVWGDGQILSPAGKIKPIQAVSSLPPMPDSLRRFIAWAAEYTLSPLGAVLAMTMSSPGALDPPKPIPGYRWTGVMPEKMTAARARILDFLSGGKPRAAACITEQAGVTPAVIRSLVKSGALEAVEIQEESVPLQDSMLLAHGPFTLSGEQQEAAAALCDKVRTGGYSATLLDGVTGSGKTEVYFEAVVETLRLGKQALVLLPEIVLASQWMARFERRFGFRPVEWHSALAPAQRRENWRAIARGEVRLVTGARSALFLPYKALGLIVVDEEHEAAYKQEDGVIYHGRDMAVARAHEAHIPVVLASASPSIETVVNVARGKFALLHLPDRPGAATLPDVEIVDMRREKPDAQHWLSARLKDLIAETLARGEQALLYLNRRGYAPLTLCRKCGFRFQSPDTASWMVLHRPRHGAPYLQCHHSGYKMPMPEKCPQCGAAASFAACGPGVERLEEEARAFFPQARIAVMTSDMAAAGQNAAKTIGAIERGEADIIIGTQMVAKGHHFPKLTLVGAVDADLGLDGGDLRAMERSYQLLHQVSGRAGREALKGRAVIQSYQPDNPVMKALAEDARDRFVAGEIERRRRAHMPPFSRLAGLIISGKDEVETRRAAQMLAAAAPRLDGVAVYGPAPAPISRLRGQYRYRLLAKADRGLKLQDIIRGWAGAVKLPSGVKLKTDIDPYSFL